MRLITTINLCECGGSGDGPRLLGASARSMTPPPLNGFQSSGCLSVSQVHNSQPSMRYQRTRKSSWRAACRMTRACVASARLVRRGGDDGDGNGT
jgi:hypothetical protein